MISYRILKVFGGLLAAETGRIDDLELKFYLSMGSKSNDFL